MFRHPIARISIFIFLVILAILNLQIALDAQSSYSRKKSNKRPGKFLSQPSILVAHGKQKLADHNKALPEAQFFFQAALKSNPLYIPAWLAMGNLFLNKGDKVRAMQILEYVNDLMEDVSHWRWEKIKLAYRLNRDDIVESDFAWLLKQKNTQDHVRQKVLKSVFASWPNPEVLLQKMGFDNLETFFKYAVNTNNLAMARYFWPLFEQINPEPEQVIRYIDKLINANDVHSAKTIWKKYFPSETLIYNPAFKFPLQNRGFGWRLREHPGVRVSSRKDQTLNTDVIQLHFTGKNDTNYSHLRQYVPLSPNQSYTLSFKARSKNLISKQRPFIKIKGLHCQMKPVFSKMVDIQQNWQTFTMDFQVPPQCQAVQIMLKRRQSENKKSFLEGDVWLTDFSLRPRNKVTLKN